MLDLLDPLLAPLAKLMVRLGVPFPELAERLKAHFVQAATQASEGKVTDSRLSVMTGLQRRDIARLKGFEPKAPRQTHLSRLVDLWARDQNGAPLDRAEFEDLAWQVRRDVHPRTMLDTLAAAGTIKIEGAQIQLLQPSYQPSAGSEDQLSYLARNMGDHLSAAVENVIDAPTHFERAAHFTGLTPDQVAELEAQFAKDYMEVLETIANQAADMKLSAPKDAKSRFRAGGYFFKETGE